MADADTTDRPGDEFAAEPDTHEPEGDEPTAGDETHEDALAEQVEDDDEDLIARVVPPTSRGKDESEKLDQFLLRRYHLHGDRRAREQLITMYLPLVRSLARRYSSRGEHFDDLVQVGAIGLIKAIDRFDLSSRRRAHDLRHAEHHRRDQAVLPRQGLVGARAARPSGAQHPPEQGDRRARAQAAALADHQRDRRGGRADAGRSARGAGDRPGLQLGLAAGGA